MAISEAFMTNRGNLQFTTAQEINAFFQTETGLEFIEWFNKHHGGKGAWKSRRIGGVSLPVLKERFNEFWTEFIVAYGGSISLMQFLCLMGIAINEVSGNLISHTERYGRPGHPGIAYLFDKISGLKVSYNRPNSDKKKSRRYNRTAFELLNDAEFLIAHQHLKYADELSNTNDSDWDGQSFPHGYPTSGKLAETGIILQTDFFKFRGRGVIQTTWRAGYVKLVQFVQNYSGDHAVIGKYKALWEGRPIHKVADQSTYAQWDELFGATNSIIVNEAILIHSRSSGNYLDIKPTASGVNGKKSGSIYYMGWRVSGSPAYGRAFKSRIEQLCTGLGN